MKSISLQISNAFDRQIRVQAAQLDMSRSDFIREAVKEKLTHLTISVEHETGEQNARPVENVSEASAIAEAGDANNIAG